MPRHQFLHGTAGFSFATRRSGRRLERSPIRLPFGQPSQQFAGLPMGQFFDFSYSEFNRAHGGNVIEENGLEQAGL